MTHDVAATENEASALPEGWKPGRLGDFCEFLQYGTSKSCDTDETGTPVLRIPNVIAGSINISDLKYIILPEKEAKTLRLATGDLLFVRTNGNREYTGRCAMFGGELPEALFASYLIRARVKTDFLVPEFVQLYTMTVLGRSFLSGRSSHAADGKYNINTQTIRGAILPLPPLAEQRAIAAALRAAREAVQSRRRLADLERERKAALMQALFTKGTRGEATKATEIGEVPEGWEVGAFDDLVYITEGQVDPKVEPYCDMLHVGSENIEPDTGRLSMLRTNRTLGVISGNYYFSSDDVLYSKIRPYLNKVALPDFQGTCSADMYPLRPRNGQLHRAFLFYWLLSEQFRLRAMSFQDRTGIPKINRNQLKSIPLPVPPLDEQREIAEALRACDAAIAGLEREAALHEELFRALLEELMTGRVRIGPSAV